ncbi:DNA ligase 1-like [Ctenocephalides felis]|uniref:DNA ligase 1-like n=1 Tax=Ctenocephalides felis TaxID=7515 RepID=UPI000E6E42D0|nr:DNA ligase 1-like [Ctenocephalides felis]
MTDIQYYENHVLNVEAELKSLKTKIKSELRALESDTSFNDVDTLTNRLKKKVSQLQPLKGKVCIMSTSSVIDKSKEHKNSIDYNVLVDPNGKWTPEEHALFLRAKQRYKDNIESIIKAIQKVMPDISAEEICDHDEWHKKFLAAREERRAEIRKWREDKRSSTSQDDSSQHSSGFDNVSQREALHPTSKEAQLRDRKERAETKRRIEKWKQLKIDKKRAEEEQREKMIKEIREKESAKVLKCELRHEAVVEWKTKRRMEAQKVLMQKEIEHMHSMQRSAEANRTLPDFRAQDQKYIARRREASLNRITSTSRPPLRVRACFPSLQRDPTHAMRPTESSIRREQRQINVKGSPRDLSEPQQAEAMRLREQARSLSVRNIPKL